MTIRHLLPILFIALIGAAIVGCDDDAANETFAPVDGAGHFKLLLVDAPVAAFEDVVLDVVGVRVHRASADSLDGWKIVDADPMLVHLLDLTNGVTALLADADLAAGHYDQIRLVLGDSNVVVVDGEPFELRVPSGSQSGVKIHHEFEIEDGVAYESIIDIDAARSVHRTGNGRYMMRPVVRAYALSTVGCIAGSVEPLEADAVVWTTVGDDTVQTFPDPATGAFKLMALEEGLYDLVVAPQAEGWIDTTITGVAVVAREITDVGSIVLEADVE